MLTQQDFINRLNQLTLRYNLTWFDVKYDVDNAIAKINAFMGTRYPKISDYFLHSQATYSLVGEGRRVEIIPEEYFHSIIIPYVAMEVLARDEEFTTIYNKYAQQVEDGLFTMFQKEFNRVPTVFRQDPTQGVFFATDGPLAVVGHNVDKSLPVMKFRIHYHVNNTDITIGDFVEDNTTYNYGDTVTVRGYSEECISFNGLRAYTFAHWRKDTTYVAATPILEGAEITITSDIHLYAEWTYVNTYMFMSGTFMIQDRYQGALVRLEIPDYVNGSPVLRIPNNFLKAIGVFAAFRLQSIKLPATLQTIDMLAFNGFLGDSIDLNDSASSNNLTIRQNAFLNTPNLRRIIIPARVNVIDAGAFPEEPDLSRKLILCRILESNKPQGWSDGWADDTHTVSWGYNG